MFIYYYYYSNTSTKQNFNGKNVYCYLCILYVDQMYSFLLFDDFSMRTAQGSSILEVAILKTVKCLNFKLLKFVYVIFQKHEKNIGITFKDQ